MSIENSEFINKIKMNPDSIVVLVNHLFLENQLAKHSQEKIQFNC